MNQRGIHKSAFESVCAVHIFDQETKGTDLGGRNVAFRHNPASVEAKAERGCIRKGLRWEHPCQEDLLVVWTLTDRMPIVGRDLVGSANLVQDFGGRGRGMAEECEQVEMGGQKRQGKVTYQQSLSST